MSDTIQVPRKKWKRKKQEEAFMTYLVGVAGGAGFGSAFGQIGTAVGAVIGIALAYSVEGNPLNPEIRDNAEGDE